MSENKRPGVYIKEAGRFPFSVAQVETAIPAFIGYTESALGDLLNKPTRITSMLEYETLFGGAKTEVIKLKDNAEKGLIIEQPNPKFLMYYSLLLFFANGGGPCYIVSVGSYDENIDKANLKLGLEALENEEEPTLIVFPDATKLDDEQHFYGIYQDALVQANNLKNRFVIMDTFKGESITTTTGTESLNTISYFRKEIDSDKYGAAYFPHLKTALTYNFDESTTISHTGLQSDDFSGSFFAYEVAQLEAIRDEVVALEASDFGPETKEIVKQLFNEAVSIVEKVNETSDSTIDVNLENILLTIDAIEVFTDITSIHQEIEDLIAEINNSEDLIGAADNKSLKDLKGTELYSEIKQLIKTIPVVLPPSSAIAGVYARVDSSKGVWSSPANVSLNYVLSPTEKISDTEQEVLNSDDSSGKSINAIRKFTGKGTLVWGARTLDGNSNEWKYISVCRFFNMVEESVKKATERFVFQPNTETTWLRIKATVENFLSEQWRSGALTGAKQEDAYYVKVGFPETITEQEVLDGIMKIEIGLAVVRPAEFIVLNFSHKLQNN